MPNVRLQSNTEKEYPCTQCGSSGNIIREDPKGGNPRLKCNTCGFLYNGQDSLQLVERGEVPTEVPKVKEDPQVEENNYNPAVMTEFVGGPDKPTPLPLVVALPRTPSYVILSKDRRYFDFVTNKGFKKKILEYEASGRTYDVYSLTKQSYAVKVDLR